MREAAPIALSPFNSHKENIDPTSEMAFKHKIVVCCAIFVAVVVVVVQMGATH